MIQRNVPLLGLLSAISVGGYLVFSQAFYGIGFPLDDSWIHQTYARNLARAGEWAFFPGQPSAGSTSPIWAAILSIGHALRLGPFVWTFLLGWGILWALSVAGMYTFNLVTPSRPIWGIWAGVLLVLEWHLVWAAGSGMETLLFALIIISVIAWFLKIHSEPEEITPKVWMRLGLLIGLSLWVRPEGVTLLAMVGASVFFLKIGWQARFKIWFEMALGFVLLVGPYLVFNQTLAGDWWPNTFYAKQAEYAILRTQPLWLRYLEQLSLPLVGVGALLLPGFIKSILLVLRSRNWPVLLATIWVMGHLGLYALRLPVTYQHGRYIIPIMPVFFMLGLSGMAALVKPSSNGLWPRLLGRAWLISCGLVIIIFWGFGAAAYARDVAFIESEMVATAKWVAENIKEGDVVAAHDIGALGYFAERPLLDLAGLVSPDVIAFIRDEGRLANYLDLQRTTYVVTFPGWYPELVERSQLIYSTAGEINPTMGAENMAVYLWTLP
ncbi:MAG: hypothetical protein FVQ83_07995 [Chloroflexi bacterium]|nr:hypothetical protein [Chloroflexota bacterium]